MKMTIPAIAAAALGCSFIACAHVTGPSVPGLGGSEATIANEAGRRVDRYLEAAQVFGFSGGVLIADRNGIVLRKGYGQADASRRVTANMIFDMGSIAKQFTAAAILLLESEGKLSTTDRLSKFFPNAPSDKATITLHQMMTHTSGLIGNLAGDYEQITRDSAVRVVLNGPLVSPPGSKFNYSNAAFSMLAVIIELTTGQNYERFMYERIYRPAGMEHTGYRLPNLDSSLVAHSYTPPVDHGTPAERIARAGGPGWNLMGNGGILTTVDDIYRYEQGLARGRPVSLQIQAKQFAEQFRRSPDLAHGYDWWIEPAEDGGTQFTRGGDGPETGITAVYRRYSRDTSTFILLANNRHHGWSTPRYVVPEMRRLYLGKSSTDPPRVRGATPHELERVSGLYRVDSASYFRVERNGDHLAFSAIGQRAVDVMIFNRDSNSIRNRERVNQRAANLIRALASQDTAAIRVVFGATADVAGLLGAWREADLRLGGFRCAEVLGTDRLDRGVFLSSVRLRFGKEWKTVRWAWSGAIPVTNSEDGRLPSTFGFGADSPVDAGAWSPYWWLTGPDSAVIYDLATKQVLSAGLVRERDGKVRELVFHLAGREVRAIRFDGTETALSFPSEFCLPPIR